MIQEDKQLLFKDLCARLPYGVKIYHRGSVEEIKEISPTGEFKNYNYNAWFSIYTCTIKPYLRPMSSMTEEERTEYELLGNHCIVTSIGFIHLEAAPLIDWLNAHHFDFRNLIEKGLALEAPEGMYKTE